MSQAVMNIKIWHTMWTPGWLDNDLFYSLKVLAHFRPEQLLDFSAYDTQILCLTGAIITTAHYNDKYNYVQDCEGLRPPQCAKLKRLRWIELATYKKVTDLAYQVCALACTVYSVH